jgi:4-diphosphocytidyl-2-C-methyl-D-erythritol kinase
VILAVAARAKLNLDLKVVGRRDDGFHEIRTHIQAIAIHDLIELAPASRTSLEVTGLAAPTTDDNSVLKAHTALERAVGRELPTRFHLHKRIPAGSGLGGASSDAAAALRGLVAIHQLSPDLAAIAPGIGADVPFFLTGGAAIATGRGEHIAPLPTTTDWFAIAWPGIELSTGAVYRAWDEVSGDAQNQLRRAAARVEPRIAEFAERLGDRWQMTGSGSAFFTTCQSEEEARTVVASIGCWTAVTQAVGSWGAPA